jgi:heat shock protein HslJ
LFYAAGLRIASCYCKRKIMKKIFLLAAICISITGVVKSQASSPDSSLFGKKWYLRKVNKIYGNDLPAFKTDTVGGLTAFIKFNKEKMSAGGNGGCNSFGGSFNINGRTIHISDIISTQMYCQGISQTEKDFFDALRKVNRYEIKGQKLILYQDKTNLLEFELK